MEPIYTHHITSLFGHVLLSFYLSTCLMSALQAFKQFPYPNDTRRLVLRTSCDAGSSPKSMAPANDCRKDNAGAIDNH